MTKQRKLIVFNRILIVTQDATGRYFEQRMTDNVIKNACGKGDVHFVDQNNPDNVTEDEVKEVLKMTMADILEIF
jgi:hypothetical protein